jgi:hypothetical protein
MTSIETSTFSGTSADIANTAAFIPEEPTHVLRYVYTTPEWHDNFIGWSAYIADFLNNIGLSTRLGQGEAAGIPGTELKYVSVIEVFAKPGAELLITLPEGLPEEGDWELVVEDGESSVSYDIKEARNTRHSF